LFLLEEAPATAKVQEYLLVMVVVVVIVEEEEEKEVQEALLVTEEGAMVSERVSAPCHPGESG
jgi:hypothetical protein